MNEGNIGSGGLGWVDPQGEGRPGVEGLAQLKCLPLTALRLFNALVQPAFMMRRTLWGRSIGSI